MATAACEASGPRVFSGAALARPLLLGLWLGSAWAPALAAPSFQTIDLSHFYTTPLPSAAKPPWNSIPAGLQTFENTPFLIGGRLEVTGLDAARAGDWLPSRIGPIPIGVKARRLHLLHGAAHGLKDGTPLSQLVLHFAQGQVRGFRLVFGIHTRNWIRDPEELRHTVPDPASALVWSSPGDSQRDPGGSLRFYQTTLLNPYPDETIAWLEVESLFSKATPIIFALTLELADTPPSEPPRALTGLKAMRAAYRFENNDYVRTLAVQAVAAGSAAPLTNASAKLLLFDGVNSFFFGATQADAAGRLAFLYPPQQAVRLDLVVQAPGRASELVSLAPAATGLLPSNTVAHLKEGRRIGGLVRRNSGRPISGVAVLAHSWRAVGANDLLDVAWDRAVTGTDGRWTLDDAPEEVRSWQLQLTHPDFKPTNYLVEASPPTNPAPASAEALFAGQAALPMWPELRLAGTVTDPLGHPVTNAVVSARFEDGNRLFRYTDLRGAFVFPLETEGKGVLTIVSPDFPSQFSEFQVVEGTKPLRLALGQGQPLALRVCDTAGQPVAGAGLALDHWNFQRLVSWAATSDAQGRVLWTSAPVGALAFSISKPGFAAQRLALSVPAAKETVVTLLRQGTVAGAVLDAATGKPLESCAVTPGQRARPDEPWRWSRDHSSQFNRGWFHLALTEQEGTEPAVLIEAPGCLPAIISPGWTAGWQTNDLALKRGAGLRGKVVLPDGTPAKGALLALVDEVDEVVIEGSAFAPVKTTNSELLPAGQSEEFEFRPCLGRHTVFALHAQGVAQVLAEEVARSGQVVLQPWGRVRGEVSTNLVRPGQDLWVALGHLLPEVRATGRPALHLLTRTRPDAKGAFQLERVPPGLWSLGLLFRNVDDAAHRPPLSHSVTLQVNPGETNAVRLGGGGRTLLGRVTVRDGRTEDLDWQRDTHTLTLNLPGVPDSKPEDTSSPTAERSARERELTAPQRAFWTSERGLAARREQRSYALLFQTNGAFRVDEVPPGDYTLDIAVTGQTLRRPTGETIAQLRRQISVKPPQAGEALDLGALDVPLTPLARPGQLAPDFAVRTLDGKTARLSDYRSKLLLLDLWDSAVESHARDLSTLLQTMSATNTAGRMAVLSLNFDANEASANAAMHALAKPWPETWLGPFSTTTWPSLLGVEQPGLIVIMDPQGRFSALTAGENLPSALRRLPGLLGPSAP